MPGTQADFVSAGADNEALVQYLLGQIANPVKVMRENDFGVDFYWQVRAKLSDQAHTVRGLIAMQVKGRSERLEYGGFDTQRKWKRQEVEWLRELPIPLFLARVDSEKQTVDVFSLGPVLRVFGRAPVPTTPFKIVFQCGDPSTTREGALPEEPTPIPEAPSDGCDGQEWHIRLGPPFLSVKIEDRSNQEFVSRARRIFYKWIDLESRNWAYHRLGIHVPLMFGEWATNEFTDPTSTSDFFYEHNYWTDAPGEGIRELGSAIAPVAVALGLHLSAQQNPEAPLLIPLLDWLQKRNLLGGMGLKLLDDLRKLSKPAP